MTEPRPVIAPMGFRGMYDLQWDAEELVAPPAVGAASLELRTLEKEKLPESFELSEPLLRQLSKEELLELAAAHAACGALTEGQISMKHARCAVQVCQLGAVPVAVEVKSRSTLAWRLSEEGKSEEALAILKVG